MLGNFAELEGKFSTVLLKKKVHVIRMDPLASVGSTAQWSCVRIVTSLVIDLSYKCSLFLSMFIAQQRENAGAEGNEYKFKSTCNFVCSVCKQLLIYLNIILTYSLN